MSDFPLCFSSFIPFFHHLPRLILRSYYGGLGTDPPEFTYPSGDTDRKAGAGEQGKVRSDIFELASELPSIGNDV